MDDEPLAIPLDEIQVDDKLHFIEEPIEIIDREVKRLNQSRILIVKVHCLGSCKTSCRSPLRQPQQSNTLDPLSQKLEDENVELELQLFDRVSEQKETSKGKSVNTKFTKQSILGKLPSSSKSKLYSVTPFPTLKVIPKVGEMNDLLKPVTSNSAPSTRESKVVKNDYVISPGIFRINLTMNSRVDNFVPNKHVKASVRTKLITVSQPQVITKKDVNSNTNGLPSTRVKSIVKTRRPQPRSNPKNDRIPSASKSSCHSNLWKTRRGG
ncbi:hypothetical protein Tco_1419185 [Tanacetum coccineum]